MSFALVGSVPVHIVVAALCWAVVHIDVVAVRQPAVRNVAEAVAYSFDSQVAVALYSAVIVVAVAAEAPVVDAVAVAAIPAIVVVAVAGVA